MGHGALGWGSIARLGLVQAALGAVVVMTTSTLNRVMVVELALPALVPGILVALHYLAQLSRPRMGHGSDEGGRRTPWIVGGMGVLSVGGALAALATVWMAHDRTSGLALAVVASESAPAARRCWSCWPSAWRLSGARVLPRSCG
jgi:MFS transporter, BCD family, chlorophyll transporter